MVVVFLADSTLDINVSLEFILPCRSRAFISDFTILDMVVAKHAFSHQIKLGIVVWVRREK